MTFLCVSPETTALGIPGRRSVDYATPAGLATDIRALLQWAEAEPDECVIVLKFAPPGLDRELFAARVTEAGWATNTTEGGWFTARLDKRVAHLCVLDWLHENDPFFDGLPVHEWPIEVCDRLVSWLAMTGAAYRFTPGVAALASIRQSVGYRRGLRWRLQNQATTEWWKPPALVTDLRIEAKKHRGAEWPDSFHRWDMRSAYLAASAAAYLPHGTLVNTGNDPQDGYGYYRVSQVPPGPWLGRPDRQGCHWMTHAMYHYLLDEEKFPVVVVDSWTCRDGSRLLRPWAENWRTQVNAVTNAAYLRTLKRGYSEAFGLMAVARGNIYRPDWRHIIIDTVRVSVLRRVGRVKTTMEGLLPVKVDVDSVWYATDDPGHVGQALGVGTHVGNMRYEGLHNPFTDRKRVES